MAWDSVKWSVYGSLFPNASQFVDTAMRQRDMHRFRNDLYRNTGRSMKYQYMRGYAPDMLWRDYGRSGQSYLNSMFSTPYRLWRKGKHTPFGGTVRNIMEF